MEYTHGANKIHSFVAVYQRVIMAKDYTRFGEKLNCPCQKIELWGKKVLTNKENRLLQHLISNTNVIAELKTMSSTDEFSLLQFG